MNRREDVKVVYAANTRYGRVFLGFSDASFCTVSAEELLYIGVFQKDLDAIGFVPAAKPTLNAPGQAAAVAAGR